jgi:oxygen-independent coproporphyrinogen-3 oxidase
MHRTHTAEQVAPAVAAIREAGIDDVSLDLIFGLPAAQRRNWERDLSLAFALTPTHLSFYGLTVEPHTALGRWTERGEVTPVDEDRYAAEFLRAHGALAAQGFEHYEVSNAALPGRRARHNSAYWRRAPFLGLGPSAHSGFGRTRRWNLRDWPAYERASAAGSSVQAGTEELSEDAIALEELYLGLRTAEGLPAVRLPEDTVTAWTEAGWARLTPTCRVRLTAEGWLRLDALVAVASA